MTVRSLGYVVVEASDPGAWRKFAVDVIGLMEGSPGADGSVRFRIDERPFRIAVIPGKRDRFVSCGWEFRDAAELESVIGTLQAANVEVRRGTEAEAVNRVRQIALLRRSGRQSARALHGHL
jgi:3,4-dihydroxy-9,10-secoandrosta-1,3,5(10)-triene-9,17-dione 4,5-dioxygenase